MRKERILLNTVQSPYHFLIRRIHSLLGLIPIGLFLTFHLILNSFAQAGPEQYNKIIAAMQDFPGIILIELLVIFIPIAFHAIYGSWVVYTGQANIMRYRYARNWFYIIQRISGIYTVIFVVVHVYVLRFGEANFAALQNFVTNPLGLIFYSLGILFAIFHFVNGLWAFAITWGITVGVHSQKIWSYICTILFLIISILGLYDIAAFLK